MRFSPLDPGLNDFPKAGKGPLFEAITQLSSTLRNLFVASRSRNGIKRGILKTLWKQFFRKMETRINRKRVKLAGANSIYGPGDHGILSRYEGIQEEMSRLM
jgi:hypothetical protein